MLFNKKKLERLLLSLIIMGGIGVSTPSFGQKKPVKVVPPAPVALGAKGKLVYTPDSLGNRIPDFSYAGYKGGDVSIPDVQIKVVVPATAGDATRRIQSAIDYVSSLPLDKNGFRGAILLGKGTFTVTHTLFIKASGVVLKGSGMQDNGTVLLAKVNERETLLRVLGNQSEKSGDPVKITDKYVPVNAFSFQVENAKGFKAGDLVTISRPSTQNWIDVLKTGHFGGGITALGWKPGDRDIYWTRTVTAVSGNKITVDAPLTTALDVKYGGGTIAKANWPGLIKQVGIENIAFRSDFDKSNPKDEDHSWMAVSLENMQDGWVRQATFKHFAGSAVAVLESASKVTVEDCKSLEPVSEIGGQRRYTFYTLGQQTLFQRCYSEQGYHDFAVGFGATGPNAFVQCESHGAYSFSGGIDSWASGMLFDVVSIDGQCLSYKDRGQDAQGAGWSAANSVFWQCTAARIDCFAPPTAQNWSFGSWSQFTGDGYWNMSNEHVSPRSFYYAQLAERLGKDVSKRAQLLEDFTEASSSPPVSVAMELTKAAEKPHTQLSEFIDSAAFRTPINVVAKGVKTIDQIGIKKEPVVAMAPAMKIRNGWIERGGMLVAGARTETPWWRGSLQPKEIAASKVCITRFVPGRTGLGLTDDLDEVGSWMKANNVVSIEHNYGLWYDRRRDDHERIRRMDGDVWPPFYEQAFARSGQGLAWDGLSKYDLTKYDKFYWGRLKHFADVADQKGLVLVHQNYFQHNIIEAGAHYVDAPWRTANNINSTGFPEPVPFAGDKRIFMAKQFYDISNSARRALHRSFIRQCLDNFKNNSSVIQLTSAEYTGPTHFVQFWLDVVKEWEQTNGKPEIIGLSATKDVQDSILADPARAAVVDLIDIRYWHYQADGSAYAPKGGLNLAPRQHARLMKPKKTSFEQVYRAVSEYRQRFPEKAVMYSGDSYDSFGWASFMAGGSVCQLPAGVEAGLLHAATAMTPVYGSASNGVYKLDGGNAGQIIYLKAAQSTAIDLKGLKGNYKGVWINAADGKVTGKEISLKSGGVKEISKPTSGDAIFWVRSVK